MNQYLSRDYRMNKTYNVLKSITLISFWVFWYSSFSLYSFSDVRMESLNDPIEIVLRESLSVSSLPEKNQVFTGVLIDRYMYKKLELPAGTAFRGRVFKVGEPAYFRRSGYLILSIDEVYFPSGDLVYFVADHSQGYQDIEGELTQKIKAPKKKGQFKRNFFRYSLPITAVGLSVSLPLRFMTDLPFYVTFPMSTGAKMAAGTTLEFIYDDHDTVKDKVLWGMYRGSGLPTLVSIVKKGRALPELEAGDTLSLEIHPDGMAKLFEAAQGDYLPLPPAR